MHTYRFKKYFYLYPKIFGVKLLNQLNIPPYKNIITNTLSPYIIKVSEKNMKIIIKIF